MKKEKVSGVPLKWLSKITFPVAQNSFWSLCETDRYDTITAWAEMCTFLLTESSCNLQGWKDGKLILKRMLFDLKRACHEFLHEKQSEEVTDLCDYCIFCVIVFHGGGIRG